MATINDRTPLAGACERLQVRAPARIFPCLSYLIAVFSRSMMRSLISQPNLSKQAARLVDCYRFGLCRRARSLLLVNRGATFCSVNDVCMRAIM